MAQQAEKKKKIRPKGERMNWQPLKDAKPIVLTEEMLKGQKMSNGLNRSSEANFLVSWNSTKKAIHYDLSKSSFVTTSQLISLHLSTNSFLPLPVITMY